MGLFAKVTKLQLLLIVFIFLAGATIRLMDLGRIPAGLTNDEANVGYDAYSILKTGKDQWGDQQPSTYLKGFGDYRPPIYTYAVSPSIALFGLNEFAVRFPSAVAGSLTILLVFFLGVLLFRNKTVGIIAMFFVAFNPWHVAMSRVGIESTFAVFFITLALVFFFYGLSRKTFLYCSMALFALSVYTYTSYVILSPIFIVLLFFLFRKTLLTQKKTALVALTIFLVGLLPLFFGGSLKTANVRSQQVNFTSNIGILNVVNEKRGECQVNFPPRICQVFQNKFAAFAFVFLDNYLHHFSPDLLATHGTNTQYSVLPEVGLLYKGEYLFFLFGLFFLLKKRQPEHLLVLFWMLIAPIPDSLTGGGHYSRFLPIVPAIQLTSALGLYGLWTLLRKKWLLLPLASLVLYEVVMFLLVYWTYFPRFYGTYSHFGYRDLINLVKSNENSYDRIILSSRVNDTKQYVYYLFYTKYDPALFQSGSDVEKVAEQDSWIRVRRIGNVYFFPSLDYTTIGKTRPLPNILVIGSPTEFPKNVIAKTRVKDLKKRVVFTLVDIKQNPKLIPEASEKKL